MKRRCSCYNTGIQYVHVGDGKYQAVPHKDCKML